MKRRVFLGSAGAAAAGFSCSAEEPQNDPVRTVNSATDNGALAGKSLAALRDEYRYWLFDDFLPFMDKYVVDHEYGGFMCNTARDGSNITQNKRGWYEGRGIWVYSFLYNHFGGDTSYLDIAGKSVEFILKHDPGRGGLWPEGYSREGKVIADPDRRGYGNLFIANGLQEYSKASGEERYFDRAKDILLDFIDFYDKPDYYPMAAQGPLGKDAPLIPGARVLGVWMVMIRLSTQMLEKRDDPEIKAVNDRCIEAITRYHLNPDFDLLNEVIKHDMSRPDNEISQLVYTGHAIETLWMLLFEAARRKDKELFYTAAEWFKRHVEIAWDDVYGGVFSGLKHVDNNDWILSKALWAQEEVLIGTLYLAENMGEQWAKDWFGRMYGYVMDKYPLKQHSHAIWNLSADRKVTYVEKYSRIGNFHHPRHLMLNLLAIDRIIERNDSLSGLFM